MVQTWTGFLGSNRRFAGQHRSLPSFIPYHAHPTGLSTNACITQKEDSRRIYRMHFYHLSARDIYDLSFPTVLVFHITAYRMTNASKHMMGENGCNKIKKKNRPFSYGHNEDKTLSRSDSSFIYRTLHDSTKSTLMSCGDSCCPFLARPSRYFLRSCCRNVFF